MDLDFNLLSIEPPSDAELKVSCQKQYDAVSFSFIDQWPSEWREVSIPTKFIYLSAEDINIILDGYDKDDDEYYASLQPLADRLDKELGWKSRFLRLNSRSPKDATYPALPITCSAKHFLNWVWGSERMIDDLCMFKHADGHCYIAARDFAPIRIEQEFRCFVDGDKMTVAQYDYSKHYERLGIGTYRDTLYLKITEFWKDNIDPYSPVSKYVFDVYIDHSGKLRLLEVNPYGLSDPCAAVSYDNLWTKKFHFVEPPNDPLP